MSVKISQVGGSTKNITLDFFSQIAFDMAKIIIDMVLLDHLLIKLHPLCAWDSFLYRPLVHTKHHFWWQDISRSFFYIVTKHHFWWQDMSW